MGLKGLKYIFSDCFYPEQTFFDKIKGLNPWILSQNSIFFRTPKTLCATPKLLTEQ
jgi:hypothetical protein